MIQISNIVKAGFLILVCSAVLSGCKNEHSSGGNLKFCPSEFEGEARQVLLIGSAESPSLTELLKSLDERGISYERAYADTRVRKCDDYVPSEGEQKYQIYAGFDSTESHTRNFLVVANAADEITYVEQRYAYKSP